MTEHIENTDMVFAPIGELTLSPMNPRQMVTEEEIDEMAISIMACGLIQSLSGYMNDDGQIEIVAGGRRLRALQLLASEQFEPAPDSGLDLDRIPVKVTMDTDLAAKWAMAENAARKAPNIADEIEAYAALQARGASVTNIAHAYAVTEIHVKRRLKLAGLPAEAIDALRADTIGYGQAAVLTLCQSAEQLDELLRGALSGWNEQRMRNHLGEGKVKADNRAVVYVGLDAYEAAGGAVTRDLFADFAVLEDGALIEKLFREKLESDTKRLTYELGFAWGQGIVGAWLPYEVTSKHQRIWPEVEEAEHTEAEGLEYADLAARADTDGLDDEIERYRYAELQSSGKKSFSAAQRSVSGVFVWVDRNGTLCHEGGHVAPADYARAAELGVISKGGKAGAGKLKPETPAEEAGLSAAVIADLKAIRLASVQSALLNVPDLLADLLAYALSPHAPRYNNVFDIRFGKPSIVPSVDEAFNLDDRLREDEGRSGDLAEGFAAFCKMPRAKRQAALHEAVARTLNYGCGAAHKQSPLFDAIESEADAGMRRVWRPTKANFFGRVPSGYLDQIYCDVFALDADHGAAKAFSGLKKSEKAVKLDVLFDPDRAEAQGYVLMTPEAAERIAAWQPAQF